MVKVGSTDTRKGLWAYAYEIVPPLAEGRRGVIRNILTGEHADANRTDRIWKGNLVDEPLVTHLLIVSDDPDQRRGVNRRLEAGLKKEGAPFTMTQPVWVADGGPAPERSGA